jgi:pre-mRNA-splicing factor SYF1
MLCTQVNMMSAQMLSAAGQVSGTVADLAPGAKDGMRMLEAKAAQMAGEPLAQPAKKTTQQGSILFVRGETQSQDSTKVVNPDEIDIDEDDEEDEDDDQEDEEEDGKLEDGK